MGIFKGIYIYRVMSIECITKKREMVLEWRRIMIVELRCGDTIVRIDLVGHLSATVSLISIKVKIIILKQKKPLKTILEAILKKILTAIMIRAR